MSTGPTDAQVWVVAGCLFEVSLPASSGASPWRWRDNDRVTLLSEQTDAGRQLFRFRAEVAGAVELRFAADPPADEEAAVPVRIAPERRS